MKKITIIVDEATAMLIIQTIMDNHIVEMHMETIDKVFYEIKDKCKTSHINRPPDGTTVLSTMSKNFKLDTEFNSKKAKEVIMLAGYRDASVASTLSKLTRTGYLKKEYKNGNRIYTVIKAIPERLREMELNRILKQH